MIPPGTSVNFLTPRSYPRDLEEAGRAPLPLNTPPCRAVPCGENACAADLRAEDGVARPGPRLGRCALLRRRSDGAGGNRRPLLEPPREQPRAPAVRPDHRGRQ